MGSRWLDIGQVFYCVFIDLYLVSANKNAKKERGQYPAILTEQAWSIQYLLYGLKENYFFAGPTREIRNGQDGPSCRSGSQSERRIRFILLGCGFSHITNQQVMLFYSILFYF